MKRELKFRFWDTEYEKYSDEPFYRLMISKNGNVHNTESDEWHTERYIIQQFTGSVDSDRVDIYEGDIVSDESGSKGLVFWNEDDSSFCIDYKGIGIQAFLNMDEWSTVIGNIYENPELL